MSSTEFYVAKDMTYKLPQGRFKAKITHVTKKPVKGSREGGSNVIINFEVFVKGLERFECCARACFPDDDSRNGKLRLFLEDLLGKGFLIAHSDQKIDLNTILRDKECEIELVHGKHNDKFDWPLVLVENVYPATEPVKEDETKK
jgi:hypothetical protein